MKLIHVAVGVIVNADGKILIAKRPLSAHQGGLWEFPGGKVDAEETVENALRRELYEELAIHVGSSSPLIQIRHHYPDKSVLLDVYKITQFSGEPVGNEGQPVQWVAADNLKYFEFPAANQPIISAINLPQKYLITGSYSNHADFVSRLTLALSHHIRLVQLRIENFSMLLHGEYIESAINLIARENAQLVLNCSVDEFHNVKEMYPGKNIGLHLNRHQARLLNNRPVDKQILFGVSCHDADEILHAQKIGSDYLSLSPVLPTLSHVDVQPMGWQRFASLAELANIPVYALGGVNDEHIAIAQSNGAQGVAGISAWW